MCEHPADQVNVFRKGVLCVPDYSKFYTLCMCILGLLRLLTHVGFLRQNGLILSEVFFVYGRKQESRKKIHHNRAKKFHLPEEV